MVYTRFGSPIQVMDYDSRDGWVAYERLKDGSNHDCHISELKADGGINEIIEPFLQQETENAINR